MSDVDVAAVRAQAQHALDVIAANEQPHTKRHELLALRALGRAIAALDQQQREIEQWQRRSDQQFVNICGYQEIVSQKNSELAALRADLAAAKAAQAQATAILGDLSMPLDRRVCVAYALLAPQEHKP